MVLPGLQLGFIETMKTTLLSGFAALPYLLIIITGFLGTTTANLGLGFLLLGQVFAVPALQSLLFFFRGNSFFSDTLRLGKIPKLDPSCALVPDKVKGYDFDSPITSNWMAQVVFFFSFLITNAISVYNLQPETGASTNLVDSRKAQSMMSLILAIVIGAALIGLYISISKCETKGSIITGITIFGLLGIAWFSIAVQCGLKQADIFGIAGKIHTLKPDSKEFAKVCVPIKNETCKEECRGETNRIKGCACKETSQCISGTECVNGVCTTIAVAPSGTTPSGTTQASV